MEPCGGKISVPPAICKQIHDYAFFMRNGKLIGINVKPEGQVQIIHAAPGRDHFALETVEGDDVLGNCKHDWKASTAILLIAKDSTESLPLIVLGTHNGEDDRLELRRVSLETTTAMLPLACLVESAHKGHMVYQTKEDKADCDVTIVTLTTYNLMPSSLPDVTCVNYVYTCVIITFQEQALFFRTHSAGDCLTRGGAFNSSQPIVASSCYHVTATAQYKCATGERAYRALLHIHRSKVHNTHLRQ